MKTILITGLFLTSNLLANYAFSNDKTVKIDMHGGKSEQLYKSSGFSKMGSGGLKGMSSFNIKKPKEPMTPKEKVILNLKDIKLK